MKKSSLPPNVREFLNIAFILLIAVGIIVYLHVTGRLDSVLQAVINADKLWLGLALLCEVLYLACEVASLVVASKLMRIRLNRKDLVEISLVGQLFGNLTPMASGSQPAQGWALTKKGVGIGNATSTLLAKFIIFQGTLTVFALIMLIARLSFFTTNYKGFTLIAIAGFLVHAGVFIGLLALGVFPHRVQRLLNRIVRLLQRRKSKLDVTKILDRVDKETLSFRNSFRNLRRHPGKITAMSAISFLQFGFFCLVPYCVLRALGVDSVDPFTAVAAAAFVLVIQSAVPIPGGAGGAEGSFALFFGLFTGSSEVTWAAVLLWRFITYYLPIIAELPVLRSVGKPPVNTRAPQNVNPTSRTKG